MIDKDKAKAAVEDAFADGVKRLFEVLVSSLEGDRVTAEGGADRFLKGLGYHVRARAQALALIDSFSQQ